jgi:hypothetical protein
MECGKLIKTLTHGLTASGSILPEYGASAKNPDGLQEAIET